jgi:hypothetical protein
MVFFAGRNIPVICSKCRNLDYETGEFGTLLCPAYCIKNIFMPTKKGTCKKFEEKGKFKEAK